MTNNAKLIENLTTLFAAMLGEADRPNERVTPELVLEFIAELSARSRAGEPNGRREAGTGERIGRLAAYLDSGIEESVRQQFEAQLAASPADIQEAIASLGYLDDVEGHRAPAPADLVDAAIAAWRAGRSSASPQADIVPLRRGDRHPEKRARDGDAPIRESFQLLAAASGTDDQAVLCRSQSGLWTLEIFVGKSEQDQAAAQGYLLLTVDADHRATYEGRAARVFVMIGNEERVLAEAAVRDGEVYAPVSLAGLDLWARDAVNVVFGPDRDASAPA